MAVLLNRIELDSIVYEEELLVWRYTNVTGTNMVSLATLYTNTTHAKIVYKDDRVDDGMKQSKKHVALEKLWVQLWK